MYREAVGSAALFGGLWGAACAVFGFVVLSAAAGKVIGAVGFAVSVLMMAGVAGLGAVLSISMGAWLFVRHPRRVRGVRNGRLRI
jgi:hypothetical protein